MVKKGRVLWSDPTLLPKEPGFYWAKLLIAEAETRQALDLPSDEWEAVWVFQNGSDRRRREQPIHPKF